MSDSLNLMKFDATRDTSEENNKEEISPNKSCGVVKPSEGKAGPFTWLHPIRCCGTCVVWENGLDWKRGESAERGNYGFYSGRATLRSDQPHGSTQPPRGQPRAEAPTKLASRPIRGQLLRPNTFSFLHHHFSCICPFLGLYELRSSAS